MPRLMIVPVIHNDPRNSGNARLIHTSSTALVPFGQKRGGV